MPERENEVALIVGGGPGVSASCARLFAENGIQVAIAARNADKPVLLELEQQLGAHLYACDAADAEGVASLFAAVNEDLGPPNLVVHNIDGRSMDIFRKPLVEADSALVQETLMNFTTKILKVFLRKQLKLFDCDCYMRERILLIFTCYCEDC